MSDTRIESKLWVTRIDPILPCQTLTIKSNGKFLSDNMFSLLFSVLSIMMEDFRVVNDFLAIMPEYFSKVDESGFFFFGLLPTTRQRPQTKFDLICTARTKKVCRDNPANAVFPFKSINQDFPAAILSPLLLDANSKIACYLSSCALSCSARRSERKGCCVQNRVCKCPNVSSSGEVLSPH